jgi:hypothetical protein
MCRFTEYYKLQGTWAFLSGEDATAWSCPDVYYIQSQGWERVS